MHRPGTTQPQGPLTRLERQVLAAMVKGDGPDQVALRAQLAGASSGGRTHSGVGFVTRLKLPADAPSAPGTAVRLPPVYAGHPQLEEPAEFLVQVRDGRLAVLEAFCHAGTWPADETRFHVQG